MIGHDAARTYKAAVIGAGSGGRTLAIGLAGFGHHVVLIDGGAIGGDCTIVGRLTGRRSMRDQLRQRHHVPLIDLDEQRAGHLDETAGARIDQALRYSLDIGWITHRSRCEWSGSTTSNPASTQARIPPIKSLTSVKPRSSRLSAANDEL